MKEKFIGKICSVFTTPLNRDFSKEGNNYLESMNHYFLGVVESFDEHGLLLTQPKGLQVYVTLNHLVAIAEEEVLDPENPDDAKIIDEYKTPEIKLPESKYVDPDALSKIAGDLKNNFDE